MVDHLSAVETKDVLILEIVLPVLAFLIPFLISGPQWLTGTLVNSFLFLSAASTKKTKLTIVVLPSIAALTHGLLFGKFTPFLFYFLPFIWIGNLILISSFSTLKKTTPYPVAILFSSLFKFFAIYLSALFYFQFHIVPKLFLSSMGLVQLATAIIGGILATSISKFINICHE